MYTNKENNMSAKRFFYLYTKYNVFGLGVYSNIANEIAHWLLANTQAETLHCFFCL